MNFSTVWWVDIQVILFVLNNNSTYPGFAFHCLLVFKIDQRLNSIWMKLSLKRYNLGRMIWETKFWMGRDTFILLPKVLSINIWVLISNILPILLAKKMLVKFFDGGRIKMLETFSTCYHTVGMTMLKPLANIFNRLPAPQTCQQ